MFTSNSLETGIVVGHIFFTILPVFFSVVASHLVSQKISSSNDIWKFLLDFAVIVTPIILNVSSWNRYVEVLCVSLTIIVIIIFKRRLDTPLALENEQTVISLGNQPSSLTLLRSSVNIFTAVCILAVDFPTFPKSFRKSRYYGVTLMDIGIGLFVFDMGIVSKPLRVNKNLKKFSTTVAAILLLGITRTVVIFATNYGQDEKEYGKHLNAFFTLGLTKLVGGLVSAVVGSQIQLLILGILFVTAHECLLHYGLADFVMYTKLDRTTFFVANREGICSLPGYVAIYLLAMYTGQFMFSETTITMQEYSKKVKRLAMMTACTWIITFICIPTIRISRRISNFGYVSWTLSIALTLLLLYIIMTDYAWSKSDQYKLPSLMEATNLNGLVFFLVANVLSGGVHMFLNPKERSSGVTFLILYLYMFLSCSFVYVLFRFKIKIC